MARSTLVGSRIRARRIDLALKQTELASIAGISPSYLNLIEHNRRSIGGRLLNVLAAALGTEPQTLAEGAETALLAALRDAAADPAGQAAEGARAEEFAGRFPGWAATVAAQARRIAALERTATALSDRLTHDPYLSAALHDVLSAVTAIRSTSAILADGGAIEPEWLARFHRNMHEDSRRLAESSRALVTYLDATGDGERVAAAPQDEVEAWFESLGWHVAALENGGDPEALAASAPGLSPPARRLAARWLNRYRGDAARLPLADFAPAAIAAGGEPEALARQFAIGTATVLRRLASLPAETGLRPFGLVICDNSGCLVLRRPLREFPLPRQGAGCPLWPLFQALTRPGQPVRALVEPIGRDAAPCRAWAVAEPLVPASFDWPAVLQAVMLLSPARREAGPALPVGAACRICPRKACPARREPSILAEGF